MNKKFLSAILFGALMVSSTGTFVSCKDYDDDIDNINKELTEVKSQISALQTKIDAGKWITSLASTTGGFTVSFSDGSSYTITNGKDGANGVDGTAGAAGKDGAEWTITEDGFWACNGEKTTVKAVGQDGAAGAQGEAGKDAQPEVEKRADGWYLWNGTEFEKVTVDTPATANVPYYYIDPTDANYAIMVIYDETGATKQEIRLPLNDGLAQILILDETRDMSISYYRYNGTAEWNGAKPLPAKGEYLITQPTKSFLIQVTPANYDLAALDLKLVNSKGEEAPVVLGEPTPYTEALSRAVSASGIFEVTVAPKDFDAETIKNWSENFQGKALSLVANESVRSTYSSTLALNNVTSVPSISWGQIQWNPNGSYSSNPYYVDLNDGNEVTITPKVISWSDRSSSDGSQYVYDAFISMQSFSKADSIKNGVKTDGLKVTANGACYLRVFVNYVNAQGKVKKEEPVSIYFYKGTVVPEVEDFALTAVSHQTTSDASKQVQLADFSTYFTKYANDEASRILWNADARLVVGGQVEIDGTTHTSLCATWEHENEYGDIVTEPVYDLVNSIVLCDKDGKNEGDKAKATNLKVKFVSNYGSTIAFENGKVTVYATVQMKQADGNYAAAQTIAIPVTIKNPTATDIAKTYAFNAADFKDNTLTVLDAMTVNVASKLTKGTLIFDADNIEYDENSIFVDADGNVTLLDAKNMGKSYTISGVQTTCMNRQYNVSFAVKFANSKSYELAVPTALSVACAGANEIKVKYGDLVKSDGYTYNYKLTNFAGVLIAANNISNMEFYADKDYTTTMSALTITADNNKNLTIKSTGDKIANNITITVYAKFVVNGETIKKSFNVTVTGAL